MFRLLTMAAWGETWPPTRMASCPRLIEMPPGLPDCRRLEPGHSIRPRPVSRLLERIDVGLVSGPDFHEVNYAPESAEGVDGLRLSSSTWDGKLGRRFRGARHAAHGLPWWLISPQCPSKANGPQAVHDCSSRGDRLRQVPGARPRRDADRDQARAGQQT